MVTHRHIFGDPTRRYDVTTDIHDLPDYVTECAARYVDTLRTMSKGTGGIRFAATAVRVAAAYESTIAIHMTSESTCIVRNVDNGEGWIIEFGARGLAIRSA